MSSYNVNNAYPDVKTVIQEEHVKHVLVEQIGNQISTQQLHMDIK